MGANQIRLSGKASNWQVYHDGSTVVLIATDGSRVELAATTDAQTLCFDDGERVLQIDTSNADAPAIKLGTQTLQTQATAVAAIAAPPPDGGSPPRETTRQHRGHWWLAAVSTTTSPTTSSTFYF